MDNYIPDFTIRRLNENSELYEFNYFISLIQKPQNRNYLCSHKGVNQLNISSYSQMYFNYNELKNKSVEIYFIVDNNYYEELVEEKDFNENLVDMIYGISIVNLVENSNIITIELLCKNENPNIKFLNYKPGEQLLNLMFNNYENNKMIVIEPLNDRILNYYINYKKPLIKLFSETGNFLIYGTIQTLKNSSIEDLEFLFLSFASINYFKRLFNYEDETLKQLLSNNMDFIKNELNQKNSEMLKNYNDIQQKELNDAFKFRLHSLNYRNVDDILLTQEDTQTAGKKRRRKTKGRKTNGRKTNGRKTNGRKTNGRKTNKRITKKE
jgi:hypothetical protein